MFLSHLNAWHGQRGHFMQAKPYTGGLKDWNFLLCCWLVESWGLGFWFIGELQPVSFVTTVDGMRALTQTILMSMTAATAM